MANKAIADALKAYNENYYKSGIDKEVIENFGEQLLKYARDINEAYNNKESEEHVKNIVNSFLKDNFYADSHYQINTSGRSIDSSIRYDNKLLVLIEAKKYDNKAEMIKKDDINKKALWEIIYYYLESSRDCTGNRVVFKQETEIRRAIITDTVNYFIFDANNIEKICTGYLEQQYFKYKNSQLAFANDTSKFYTLISDYFTKINITEKLDFICFNLKDLYKNKSEWKNIYKIFSNYFLLKDTYNLKNSTHKLNNKFYQELLYIMGMKEEKKKNKLYINIDHTIKNSLADQVYNKYVNDKEVPEETAIERTFELIIIWINRLLFIKLFENQLMTFNTKEEKYQILNNQKIKSFEDLQNLFFNVLGRKIEDREKTEFYENFSEIPYLNSSLFEKQDIESRDITINDIKNVPLKKSKSSVLNNKEEILLLDYIIDFLNSYNFGVDLNDDGTYTKGKDIIDASVLGLIFEKINGYKDGAFFTPSVITENICKKLIENLIISKINAKYMWNCKKMEDIRFKIQNAGNLQLAKDINQTINELKICDPAVGSGHFLVSALNRLIAAKAELGVLFEYNSNNLLNSYDIFVSDDILNVQNAQGDDFVYNQFDINSQKVQETLFNEKKIIIENCLFGVDINSKAVSICQLRLWIELLKNAYYKNHIMETLPNIDINIKVGNSLIHKVDFEIGKKLSNNIEIKRNTLKDYKEKVKAYKSTSDKSEKKKVKNAILNLKNILYDDFVQMSLFEIDNSKAVKNMNLYEGTFEWAFEFPEILGENGEFLGFDAIIGNPPYGANLSADEKEFCKINYRDVHTRTPDTYIYFISLAEKLIKKSAQFSYIVPNNLLFQTECEKTRVLFLKENIITEFINLGDNAFEDANVPTAIFRVVKEQKDDYEFEYKDYRNVHLNEVNWGTHKIKHLSKSTLLNFPPYVIGIDTNNINLINKLKEKSNTIDEVQSELSYGITTSNNSIYVLTREKALENGFENEFIKPIVIGENIRRYLLEYHDQVVIYAEKNNKIANAKNIFRYLEENEEELKTRKGISKICWWALHRARKPSLFENDKIILRQTGDEIIATFDETATYSLDSTMIIQLKENEKTDYYFVTGILNSSINNYVYKTISQENGRALAQVKPVNVKQLLIPKIDENRKKEIASIVKNIIQKRNTDSEYDFEQEQKNINSILYDYYELSNNDIKLIESVNK